MATGAAAWTMLSIRRAAAPASPRTGSTRRKVRPEISSARPSSESRVTASANGSISSIDTVGTLPAREGSGGTGWGRCRAAGRRAEQTVGMPEIDVHRLFDRVAHLYDMGWLQRALYLAVQDRALAELRAFRPGSVLDVGCGTGIFATRIDQELTAAAVAGCDISAGMLAQAARRSRPVRLGPGDSAPLPVPSGREANG